MQLEIKTPQFVDVMDKYSLQTREFSFKTAMQMLAVKSECYSRIKIDDVGTINGRTAGIIYDRTSAHECAIRDAVGAALRRNTNGELIDHPDSGSNVKRRVDIERGTESYFFYRPDGTVSAVLVAGGYKSGISTVRFDPVSGLPSLGKTCDSSSGVDLSATVASFSARALEEQMAA